MALNIVAERKVSLKGFAEGWDSCYLFVRSVNEEERIKIGKTLAGMEDGVDDMAAVEAVRDAVRDVLIRGRVMSTDEDGKTRAANFSKDSEEDFEAVVGALNMYWLQEVLLTATGLDRSVMA